MNTYVVEIIINEIRKYLLWYSNENDGFFCSNDNILYFNNNADCLDYAKMKGMTIEKEYTVYDLNLIKDWIITPNKDIDCNYFLEIWNLFNDISFSLNVDFIGNYHSTNSVYDKLFFGCNLPSISYTSKDYIPRWTYDEIEMIKNVFLNGLNIIIESIKKHERSRDSTIS